MPSLFPCQLTGIGITKELQCSSFKRVAIADPKGTQERIMKRGKGDGKDGRKIKK
jgi:hypothetical protein